MNKKVSIVTIGGGTGSYVVLRALKNLANISITSLVTTVDDGGIARKERDEFGLLLQSDLRKAIVALSPEDEESTLRELFTYRFDKGTGLEGVTLGNLIMAALSDLEGSQHIAIKKIQKLLNIQGKVVPITKDKTNILIELEDGKQIFGETSLDNVFWDGKKHIKKLQLVPKAKISKQAAKAIKDADFIFITPGDLYGSIIVNFCTQGFKSAIKESRAKLVYTCNLFTKYGQTYGYGALDHIKDLEKYMLKKIDIVILNSGSYHSESLVAYAKENAQPVVYNKNDLGDYKVYLADLLIGDTYSSQKGDKIARSLIRHDSKALKEVYREILNN